MSDSVLTPRYGVWQSIAVALGLGTRALDEVRALKAAPAPAARFPAVKLWAEGVHYAGDVVVWKGSTYQAAIDTAREPPHGDWTTLAIGGIDGRDAPIGEVFGKYDPTGSYKKFDLVAHDGCEWRARCDDPGPLPGAGWALAAMRGSQGSRGLKGDAGERGPAGPAGARITRWSIDGFAAVPIMSDGSAGPALDLREMFERYDTEARR